MIDEPLVRAIAKDEAIVFVGSGASIPSGLPDWRGFLTSMLEYANDLGHKDWARTEDLLKGGDFLLAAEMLQRELPRPTFTRFIEDTFGKPGLEPNEIHRSIARLPFSLAVTTNIDILLEAAYGSPTTCTWRDPDAVFNAIRSKKFAVVKLHGSVSDPLSARLTRTHYRDGTLTNPEFNECIKHLLTWKTCLFVGYSLRDSDLLYLIDEARLRFGEKFGPHYAIMPEDEADPKFRAYLKDALSIETIPYVRNKDVPATATAEVVRILKDLAGRVSEARYGEYGIGLGLSDLSMTRDEVAQEILDRAAPMTGSRRADVAMIQDDIYPELRPAAIFPCSSETPLPKCVAHKSVIESVFLQAAKEAAKDYVYIKDVSAATEDLRGMGYDYAEYKTCDTAVKSELACPIVADGRRVGTLNFESDLIAAYTPKHIKVATRIAAELGRVYLQSEQRRRTAAPIEYYDKNPNRLAEMLRKSRLIKNLNNDFLLYVIDYENRQLKANHPADGPITYPFGVNSLARRVFSTRKEVPVEDVEVEAKKPDGLVNRTGIDQYKIKGPAFACPVRAAGQTEGVLVTWLREQTVVTEKKELLHWFESSSRQVLRLANLLANDIFRPGTPRVESLLNAMYAKLEPIDKGEVWAKKKLDKAPFRAELLDALVESVLLPDSGLKRVRVWLAEGCSEAGEPTRFRIIKWRTVPEIRGQQPGKFINKTSPADNIYSQYTISRYHQDPFAKWQHPAMFSQEDPMANDLKKDPRGSWIVAPIVKTVKGVSRMQGFVSADMHVPIKGGIKDLRSDDPREIAFQCRLLDVIADLAQYVLPKVAPVEDRSKSKGALAS